MYFSNNSGSEPVYISKAMGVKEYAYVEDMNAPFRNTMEDGHFVVDNFLGDSKSILFGVVDGHGGRDVVDYILKNFSKARFPNETNNQEFATEYGASKKNVKAAFEKTFLKLDEQLKKAGLGEEQGCTACVGFILLETGKKVLYIANVGDTRAVLGQMAAFKRVSYDHKATDNQEIERVKKDGGSVLFQRVEGLLAITRAFGDFALKSKGVTALPYVDRIELRLIDKFLVVATDGLWDVISDEDSIDIIKNREGALNMAKKLLAEGLAKGSRDNTSILVFVL